MVSGGGRSRPQEDSLNNPIDVVVGTPGRILQHIEDGNMVYGDIKYLVRFLVEWLIFFLCLFYFILTNILLYASQPSKRKHSSNSLAGTDVYFIVVANHFLGVGRGRYHV